MPMSGRLLRPRAAIGGFDPRTIQDCTAWFNASRSLTLNGSTVLRWPNLVSGGVDFLQETAANQPSSSTLGGRRSVLFPGTSTVNMLGPTIEQVGNTSTNTLLMFFVLQYVGAGPSTLIRFLSQGTDTGGNWGWYPKFSDNNSYFDFPELSPAARIFGSVSATTISTAATICRLRRAGSNASLHYNATQIGTRTGISGVLFSNTAAEMRLNGQPASNSVNCAEIIGFSRDLTASEVQAVESGLAKTYGVVL